MPDERSLRLGKVLLTGQASPRHAIDGFNAGVIDRFIRKDDREAIRRVVDYVRELERKVTASVGDAALSILQRQSLPFLGNPALLALLADVTRDAEAVWVTVSLTPPGVTAIDKAGRLKRWLVMDDEAGASQLEVAREAGAPEAFMRAILRGTHLPFFLGARNAGGTTNMAWSGQRACTKSSPPRSQGSRSRNFQDASRFDRGVSGAGVDTRTPEGVGTSPQLCVTRPLTLHQSRVWLDDPERQIGGIAV